MPNAAQELADLLESWTVPRGSNPHAHRTQVATNAGHTLRDDHARAVRLLAELDRRVDDLARLNVDVDHFRETMPRWQEALLSYPLYWRSSASNADQPCIAQDHLRLLRALGSQLDLLNATLAPSPDRIAAALEQVDKAEQFVRDATDINEGTRHYLLSLLAYIRDALTRGDANRAAPPSDCGVMNSWHTGHRVTTRTGRSTAVSAAPSHR